MVVFALNPEFEFKASDKLHRSSFKKQTFIKFGIQIQGFGQNKG